MKNVKKAVQKCIKNGLKNGAKLNQNICQTCVQNEYFLVAFGVENGAILAPGQFDTGVARERIKKTTKKYGIFFLHRKVLIFGTNFSGGVTPTSEIFENFRFKTRLKG
jgi:hypothetical protein